MDIVYLKNPSPRPFWLNGSICDAWGKRWLVYRLCPNPSVIAISEVMPSGQLTPAFTLPLCNTMTRGPQDPRVIFYQDKLHCLYTGCKSGNGAAMHIATIEPDLRVSADYPCSGIPLSCYEKNWVPFVMRDAIYASYSVDTMLRYLGAGRWQTIAAPRMQTIATCWSYGEIRGGATIVERHNHWHHFFHSSRVIGDVTVYYMGCYTFDEHFAAQDVTRLPILCGSIEEYRQPWPDRKMVAACFPCGCIREQDHWLISYGWMDAEVRLVKLPFTELAARLTRVKGENWHAEMPASPTNKQGSRF